LSTLTGSSGLVILALAGRKAVGMPYALAAIPNQRPESPTRLDQVAVAVEIAAQGTATTIETF
jgi:hypothetical protein